MDDPENSLVERTQALGEGVIVECETTEILARMSIYGSPHYIVGVSDGAKYGRLVRWRLGAIRLILGGNPDLRGRKSLFPGQV